MGKFEGPFGVPTPERVFADYEEKQRKMNNFNGGSTICINYNDNNDDIDDLYDYCDDNIDDLYDYCDKLYNMVKSLDYKINKLNRKLNKLEQSHLINPIRRI